LTAIALVGTLAATAVVGAFDAVLLIAVPTYFFWTLVGALAPPGIGGIEVEKGVRFLPVGVLVAGVIMIGRSSTQIMAMGTYDASTRVASLESAARLDPGSYRIRVRLAQAYIARGDCTKAKTQARAARALFPSAGEPKRLLATCGAR